MDPAKLVGALAPLFVFACSSSAATGGDDAFTCLGVRPPAAAYGASPSPLHHGATYGLDAFRGRAVLVGLWAGW